MTDLLSDVDTPSDAELISRVRGGDVAAYGDLFSRHKDAANRLARQLVRGPDADDLVAEAFAKVLSVLQGGGGPDVAFRAYLLTAVRRLHVDRIRSGARVQTTDDLAPFDAGVPFQDTAVAGFESGAAAKAFASLPERWQLVLWHLEVEGQKPADIAPLLGMSANSVSALAYRAREGLRQAFLTMHLSDTSAAQCRWVNEHLGAYVRKGLAKRDAAKVQSHLDECRRCTAMYLELTEVNSNLAGIIAPLLLGAAAAGYVSATSGGAGAAGVLSLIGRARDVALANSGAVTAGAVATGVAAAAVATVVVVQVHKNEPDVVANPSQGVTSVLPSSPRASSTDRAPSASPTNSAAPVSTAATPTLAPTPTVSLLPRAGTTLPVVPSATVPVVESPGVPAATDTASPTDTTSATPTPEPASPTTEPPSPTTEPPSATIVDLSGTTIDDSSVHLVATGSSLPDRITVRLHSEPSGTVFDIHGDCLDRLDDQSVADCDVTTSGGTDGAERYTADLPIDPNTGPSQADLSLAVELPTGFAAAGGADAVATHHYVQPPGLLDVSLAPSLTPAEARPGRDDHYELDAQLSVTGPAAPRLDQIRYTVAGGTFADGTTATTLPASDASPRFVVVPTDPANPGSVTITAQVADGFTDTDGDDNTATATLRRYHVTVTDLHSTPPTTGDEHQQTFTATVDDDGFPDHVLLTASAPDGDQVSTPTLDGDQASFTVTGDQAGDVTLTAHLPEGWTDADPTNHTSDTTTYTPAPATTADVWLTPIEPALPERDSSGFYVAHTTLHVSPNGPPKLTLTIPADVPATFAPGEDYEGSGKTIEVDGPADGRKLDLLLAARPSANLTVEIGVALPDPWVNTHPTTTVSTTLAPDVVLSSVTLTKDTAPVASVRASVVGVSAGVDTLRIRLDGPDAGLGDEQVHFIDGAYGAGGQGLVTCRTTDEDGRHGKLRDDDTYGLYATCIRVDADRDGSFFVNMHLAHPHRSSSTVTFTVQPIGGKDTFVDNNTSDPLTLN